MILNSLTRHANIVGKMFLSFDLQLELYCFHFNEHDVAHESRMVSNACVYLFFSIFLPKNLPFS